MEQIKIIAGHFAMCMLLIASLFSFSSLPDEISTKNFLFAGAAQEEDLDNDILVVANSKMNALYIGIDNPISVAACGINSRELLLSCTDPSVSINSRNSGRYTIQVRSTGLVNLKVNNTKTGKSQSNRFRIKRIPDPVVTLDGKTDGIMGSGTMAAQTRLNIGFENFDFDARCKIQSYTLYYTQKNRCPIELAGDGANFAGAVLQAIQRAKPGDQYAFTNVKARCPGDRAGRKINGLSFKIR